MKMYQLEHYFTICLFFLILQITKHDFLNYLSLLPPQEKIHFHLTEPVLFILA